MAQLVVTVEEARLVPALKEAISMLKGVVQVKSSDDEPLEVASSGAALQDIPGIIRRLTGIASDLKGQDVQDDARLSYLLNK